MSAPRRSSTIGGGSRFSTYATWWIRQAVARARADIARTIRIPVHIVEKLNKIGRAERGLATALGRDSTAEEIADVTGVDPREVEAVKLSARAPISLETPVGDDEQSEFGHFIADEQAESPYERAVNILTNEGPARRAPEPLLPRAACARASLRLGREPPYTLDEVGRTFNVTRERIRQIENESLKKLQDLREAQQLRDGEIASGLRCAGSGTEPRCPSTASWISGPGGDADEARLSLSRPARSCRRTPTGKVFSDQRRSSQRPPAA